VEHEHRPERPDQPDRHERFERFERFDRPDRPDRFERPERPDGTLQPVPTGCASPYDDGADGCTDRCTDTDAIALHVGATHDDTIRDTHDPDAHDGADTYNANVSGQPS
jgi:hypothetical protein